MTRIENKFTIDYGLAHSTYWINYAAIGSFASVFLLARGYTNSAIGTILAIVNILSIFIQMFVATLLDHSKNLTITKMTSLMSFIMIVMCFVEIIVKVESLPLTIAFIILLSLSTSQHPLINSLLIKFRETGVKVPYGIPRSFGSFSFAICTSILGKVVNNSVDIIPIFSIITALLIVVVMYFCAKHYKEALSNQKNTSNEKEVEVEQVGFKDFIKNNKYFMIACVGGTGLFFAQGLFNSFCLQICTDVGGTSADMGNILGLAALFEIPAFTGFDILIKKFNSKTILKVSSIAFAIKVLLAFLAKNMFLVYVAQVFHMFAFGLFMPSVINFTDLIMTKKEAMRGQSLSTMVITLGGVLASLVGGFVIDGFGVKTLLLIGVVISAAGAALFVPMIEKSYQNYLSKNN